MPRLTATPLTSDVVASQRDGWLWDSVVPGLGLLRDGARHVYVVRWRDSTGNRRRVLGPVSGMTLDAARQAAALGAPRLPKSGRGPKALTVESAARSWLALHKSRLRPSTVRTYQQCIDLWLGSLARKALPAVTKEDLIAWYAKVSVQNGVSSALKTLRFLRAVASELATEQPDILSRNPFAAFTRRKIAPAAVESRDRLVPKEKLPDWWKATEQLRSQPRDFLRFLLLTGLRLTAARKLLWSDLNMAAGTLWLDKEKAKNAQRAELPLGPHTMAILDARHASRRSQFVFPGHRPNAAYSGAREAFSRVGKAIGLPHSAHDLRRTRATIAGSLSVSTIILQRLLTHKLKAAPLDSRTTGGYVLTDADALRPVVTELENEIVSLAGAVAIDDGSAEEHAAALRSITSPPTAGSGRRRLPQKNRYL